MSAEYRQRVCMHEAGHFLVAYLMGVLPKGYTLSAVDALRRYGALNIQAGTVFCDRVFQSEVRKSLSLPGGVPHGRAAQGLHAAACSRARCANLFRHSSDSQTAAPSCRALARSERSNAPCWTRGPST